MERRSPDGKDVGMERLVRSERLYEGRIVNLRRDTVTVERRSGPVEATREVVEHSHAVVIVPVTDQGEVLLVRQHRWSTGETLLEAPAGGLEEGESPEATAHRELREETGHRAERLVRLGSYWMAPGWATEYMHAFLATGLRPDPLPPDPDEVIETVAVAWDRVPELVREGQVRDAKSVAALLMAYYLYPEETRGRG